MTPEQLEKIRRLNACTMRPHTPDKRFVRQLASQPAGKALTPKQVEYLDRLMHRYRKQLGRFGPLPRRWTPKELLERGELEVGEEVRVDGPGDILIRRSDGRDLHPSVAGLYSCDRENPDRDTLSFFRDFRRVLYPGGDWGVFLTWGAVWPVDPTREDFIACFDSLPELLDALYVATPREEVEAPQVTAEDMEAYRA